MFATAAVWWGWGSAELPATTVQPMAKPAAEIQGKKFPDHSVLSQIARDSAANTPQNLDYSALNPATYALTAADFRGHPAYGRAMLYKTCAGIVEAHKNFDQDLAELQAVQRNMPVNSPDIVAQAIFNKRTEEIQCQNVSTDDMSKIGSLMKEAADAGDISARGQLLSADADKLFKEAQQRRNGDGANNAVNIDAKKMLAEALDLAQSGDQRSAFVAARLMTVPNFGLQDTSLAASWTLVAMQMPGQPFDPNILEDQRQEGFTAEQRKKIALQAHDIYAKCCNKPM